MNKNTIIVLPVGSEKNHEDNDLQDEIRKFYLRNRLLNCGAKNLVTSLDLCVQFT
jgi:hypothetical protein